MKKLLVAVVSFSATAVLLGGATFAAPSISNTGYKSKNKINVKNVDTCKSTNENYVGADNSTSQKSKTGKAKVSHNTMGGSATTGNAATTNVTGIGVTLANGSACSTGELTVLPLVASDASIDTTGSHSLNVINQTDIHKVTVSNENNLWIGNSTWQNSKSGDATVSGNTSGGNAMTGDANSTNATNFVISITNN